MKIVKRSGKETNFDCKKIISAIQKANESIHDDDNIASVDYREFFYNIVDDMCGDIEDEKYACYLMYKYKQRQLMRQRIKKVLCLINKNRLIDLLRTFAYDIVINILGGIIATLIVTAILVIRMKERKIKLVFVQ